MHQRGGAERPPKDALGGSADGTRAVDGAGAVDGATADGAGADGGTVDAVGTDDNTGALRLAPRFT